MARPTFIFALVGNPSYELLLQRALKKILSPKEFHIIPHKVSEEELSSMRARIAKDFSRKRVIPSESEFAQMEAAAICTLETIPSANIAVVVEWKWAGWTGIIHQPNFSALLVDAQRRRGEAFNYNRAHLVPASIFEPQFKYGGGITKEQEDVGLSTVLQKATKGWQSWFKS